jgi:hypothetical protein
MSWKRFEAIISRIRVSCIIAWARFFMKLCLYLWHCLYHSIIRDVISNDNMEVTQNLQLSMANSERRSVVIGPWSVRFEEKGRNCIIGSLNDTAEHLYVIMVASNFTPYVLFLSQRLVYHLADSSRTRSEICNRSSYCLHCRICSSSSLYSYRRGKKSHRLCGRRNSRCKIPFPPASCYKPKLVVVSIISRIAVTVSICVRRMDKQLKGLMRKHSRCGSTLDVEE